MSCEMKLSTQTLLLIITVLFCTRVYSTSPDPQIFLARNLALLDSAHRKLDQDIILEGNLPIEEYKKLCNLEFRIIRETTNDGLLEFTRHENPDIRQLGIESLDRRNSPLVFQVALERICDSALLSGTSFDGTIANLAFRSAKSYYWGDTTSEAIHSVRVLDSIALFTECGRRNLLFQTMCLIPPQEWHDSIRSLVSNHRWGSATIALARFEDTNDVELLLDTIGLTGLFSDGTFNFLFFATWFHDERILTRLEELLPSNQSQTTSNEHPKPDLYAAIASYKNKRSAQILSQYLQRVSVKRAEFSFAVHYAMMRSDREVYDSLLLAYWSESRFMMPRTAVRLCRNYPTTAIPLAFQMLESIDSVDRKYAMWQNDNSFPTSSYCKLTVEESFVAEVDTLLCFLQSIDSGWWTDYICNRLEVSTYEEFESNAREVTRSNHPRFIEPLFERYSNDDFYYDPVIALRALLSYEDQDIRKRLVAIRKRRPHLLIGWSGREIDSLYKSKGLGW